MDIYLGKKKLLDGEILKNAIILSLIFVTEQFHAFKLFAAVKYLICLVMIIITFNVLYKLKSNNLISRWYKFFIVYALSANLICQLVLFNQPFYMSVHATLATMGGWFIFGYFLDKKDIKDLENTLVYFIFIYLAIYLFAYFFYRNIRNTEEGVEGIARYFFGDYNFAIISFYLLINKFVLTKESKYLYLLVVPAIIIVMIQTRHVFVAITIVLAFYLYKRLTSKIVFYAIIATLAGWTYISPIIVGLIEKTEKQREELQGNTSNYVRFKEYEFYFTRFNETLFQNVFGNGIAQSGSPMFEEKTKSMGLVADVGYAGIYIYWGWVGLVLFGILFFKVWRIKLPEEYKWMWMAFLSLYLQNLMSFSFRNGSLCLILVCYFLYLKQQSLNTSNNPIIA